MHRPRRQQLVRRVADLRSALRDHAGHARRALRGVGADDRAANRRRRSLHRERTDLLASCRSGVTGLADRVASIAVRGAVAVMRSRTRTGTIERRDVDASVSSGALHLSRATADVSEVLSIAHRRTGTRAGAGAGAGARTRARTGPCLRISCRIVVASAARDDSGGTRNTDDKYRTDNARQTHSGSSGRGHYIGILLEMASHLLT